MEGFLPLIYKYVQGQMVPAFDPYQNIERLMEYIRLADEATGETIKLGEPTEAFGFYSSQMVYFAEMMPNFDACKVPDKHLSRVLSGYLSDCHNRKRKAEKEAMKGRRRYNY